MRIRYKKWARPELEASEFYEDEPEKWKGKWKEHYDDSRKPFMLELGCGKGQFISKLAVENQNINFLAIDLVDAMLGLAKRNIEQEYKNENLEPKNVIITRFDIERINLILDKKDDDGLFESSLTYFEESGFEILKKTYDLHEEPIFERNIETEHEKMFSEQGIRIKALIARLKE